MKTLLLVLLVLLVLLFTVKGMAQDKVGFIIKGATILQTPNITFPNAFVIHSDSGNIEWLNTPDSAGMKFAYWFSETYNNYVISLKRENSYLRAEVVSLRDELVDEKQKSSMESKLLDKKYKAWQVKFEEWVKLFEEWKKLKEAGFQYYNKQH